MQTFWFDLKHFYIVNILCPHRHVQKLLQNFIPNKRKRISSTTDLPASSAGTGRSV